MDTKEQSVRQKVNLSTWKCSLKWVCAFDIDQACDKKDSKEIYSTVRKGHKTKPEQANGDYWGTNLITDFL